MGARGIRTVRDARLAAATGEESFAHRHIIQLGGDIRARCSRALADAVSVELAASGLFARRSRTRRARGLRLFGVERQTRLRFALRHVRSRLRARRRPGPENETPR